MALLLKRLYENVLYVTYDIADPVTKDIFMVSPLYLVVFIISYHMIVRRIAPKFMENRKPYNIRNIIIIYNVLQIVANTIIAYYSYQVVLSSSHPICLDSPLESLKYKLRISFYLLKQADCIETIFFVLRKSYRQVSFLHLYHHSGMVWVGWIGTRYNPGDIEIYVGLINCFVHSVMFVYYLLTSINPEYKKNLTLKKAVTQIQLIQFLAIICIFGTSAILSNCKTLHPILMVLWMVQNLYMLTLFGDFYYKTYWKKEINEKSYKN